MAEIDELCPGYSGVYGLLFGFIGQVIRVVHKALKPVIYLQNHVLKSIVPIC